jgi:hypothetical protein
MPAESTKTHDAKSNFAHVTDGVSAGRNKIQELLDLKDT